MPVHVGLPPLPTLEHLALRRVGSVRDPALLRRFAALQRLGLTDVRHLESAALGGLDLRVEALRSLPLAERDALRELPNVTLLE